MNHPHDNRIEDIYELSAMQQGMLFQRLYDADAQADTYFEQILLTLDGALDVALWQQAWQKVTDRHGALRSAFHWEDLEQPLQIVERDVRLPWEFRDWRDAEPAARASRLDALLDADRARGIALDEAPLMRFTLIRWDEQHWQLLWSHHHILFDGWSMAIVLNEVAQIYEASHRGQLPALTRPPQFRDYIQWVQAQDHDAARAYWQQRLQGFGEPTPLPLARPATAPQALGEAKLVIAQAHTTALREVARQYRLTLNNLLQGAWALLLARYSRADEVVFGVTVSGRPAQIEGVGQMVGLLINTLPLRVRIDEDQPVLAWLQGLQSQYLDQEPHQFLPLAEIQAKSDVAKGHALFESILIFESYPVGRDAPDQALTIGELRTFEQSSYPLTLVAVPEATLELRLHYDKGRFDEGSMQIVLEQLGAVLHDLSRAPGMPLRQISLLGEADQSRLRAWNRTEVDRPADLTVVDLFERAVDLTPDATAVVVADTALSYAELERRANRVARALIAQGVGPDSLVGLCVPRSLELVVGLLGILKAGGAYVPMDPEYPVERLRFMVEDAGAPIVLAHSQVLTSLPHSQALVLQLDDPAFTTDQSGSRPARRAGPTDLAYVIYTSGSTGLPKGVAVAHGALSHSNFARLHHTGDHVPAHTLIVPSFSFDAFSGTLWHVLTSGRTVELPQDISDLAGLQARIRHHGIDGLVAPPVWYQALLDQAPTPFPALRQITTGGEASAQTLLKTHFRMAPSARFFNEYGPTEAAVWCTVAEWTDVQQNTRVIGRPIANTRIHLLDSQNLPVPPGIAGELCIAGAGLARGYLNRPELTAEKFVTLNVLGRVERLYRTGDLARWLPDGQIEFLGRIDHQVKLRGLRIELGEIEAALCAHAGVRAAVVTLHEREGQQALAGYVVLREPVDASALKAWLKSRLPEYMVPASLTVLDALPVTPNGKVDRRALPEPARQEAVGRALSGPTEELLGAIWAEVLGRTPVSSAAHFFEMGGHSLLAIRVASRVHERFEIECPLRVLFEHPVLGDLAAWLDTRQRGSAVEVIPLLAEHEVRVLSPGQQRLWFLAQLEGASSAYNMPVALRLDGPLDESALRRSLVGLTTRQASLRQSFPVENGQPGLHEGAPWDPLQVVDLRQYGPSEQAAEVARRVHEHAHAPFDLAAGPLFKVSLLRLDDQANVLLLNLHHSVGDGWSVALLVREWAELYRAACTDDSPRLAPLPIAYRDVAAWQQRWIHGDAAAQQLAWWVEQLQGAPALLELPADYPRPAQQSYSGASFFRVIPPELSRAVATLAQAEGATVFMALLSALQVVLHRHSGQDDLCIGTPMANRGHASTEGLVGLFANTLVLRSRLQPDQPFAELLGQTRQMALGAFARQELPFERLVEALQPARSLAHTPLFQVMFVLQNNERVAFDLHGLRADLIGHDDSTAKFDLTLSAKETPEGIVCDWEFATDLFTPARIERLAYHFEQVLRVITQAPDTPVQHIALLTEADKAQLIEWNRSEADLLRADQTVVDLFEQQADRTPQATAVVFEDASLSYAELDRRANQIAHALIARSVGPDTLVGLCVPRSLEMVIGLLGILKAGAAYVPLDPDYPAERLRFMVEDSAATVVLTHSAVLGSLPQSQADLLRLDDQSLWSRRPENRPHRRAAPADLAYAIYTSGSTGRPKGVMLPHGALANLIAWQVRQPALADACPTLQFTSLSFDVSFQEIFATWCSGGALVLVRDDIRRDAHALLAYLGTQRIERLYLPFVALHHLAEEAVSQPCDLRLRSVITAGEQLQMTPALRTWLVHDGITLHNHYGPTESHVVTAYTMGSDAAQWQALPPIGRPIANTRIHILDGRQQPVPPGNPGELCIAGAGLARGYLNRPELTAEKFITTEVLGRVERLYRTGDLACWLPNGTLEYLGRIDRQVKLRGFRIELGEIEAVVAEHPKVAECVVTCSESDNSATRRLVGHLVVRHDAPTDLSDERLIPALREFLKTRLPDHMVPAAFLFHEALPLTPNGKIDRAALAAAELAPQAVSSVVVAPRSVLELKILKIWQEVLKTDALDVHDNFFDVGGNSLMVTGLAARIERDLGERIPIVVLFRENSIARQATYLQSDRACASWSLLVPMQPLGDRPPLFCVHPGCGTVIWYRHLARHFGQRQPLYALESQGIGEAEKPLDRIEDMASRYLQAIRSVQPQGPYAIAGWCFGALVAFEMAQQLLKAGEQVASLTFFDAQDPHQSFDEALLFDVPFFVKLFSRDVPSLEALQHEIAGLDEDVQLQRMIDEARRAGEVADDFDLVQARRQLAIFRGHIVGQRDYRVSRYPGKVAFIQAADGEAPQAADPIFGWGRYVGEVELHWVPGDHTGIMTEPHVGQLADTVERLLACSN